MMTPPKLVLPPRIDISGDQKAVVEVLYKVFRADFIDHTPKYRSWPVLISDVSKYEGKENSFWHMIQCYQKRGPDGQFDPPRAERLPWIRPIIEFIGRGSNLLVFDFQHKPFDIRRYFWIKSLNYVIVLKVGRHKYLREYILITAFVLDYAYARQKMEEKYEKRLKIKQPPT